MTLYARMDDDRVIEVIDAGQFPLNSLFHEDFLKNNLFVECSTDVVAGMRLVNGVFIKDTPTEEEALPISLIVSIQLPLKQFVKTLFSYGYITEQEIDNWLMRVSLPEIFNKILATLDVDQRIENKLSLFTMTTISRDNSIINLLIEHSESILGKKITEKDMDEFWKKALTK